MAGSRIDGEWGCRTVGPWGSGCAGPPDGSPVETEEAIAAASTLVLALVLACDTLLVVVAVDVVVGSEIGTAGGKVTLRCSCCSCRRIAGIAPSHPCLIGGEEGEEGENGV